MTVIFIVNSFVCTEYVQLIAGEVGATCNPVFAHAYKTYKILGEIQTLFKRLLL